MLLTNWPEHREISLDYWLGPVSSQEPLTSRASPAKARGESERFKDNEKDSTRHCQLEDEGATSQGSSELCPSASRRWILPTAWMNLETEPPDQSPAPSDIFCFYFEIIIDSQEVPKTVQGGPPYLSPSFLHADILHNYSAVANWLRGQGRGSSLRTTSFTFQAELP